MRLEAELRAVTTEKASRVYYQSIVYDVCNWLDRMDAGLGAKVVCGTVESPSRGVQAGLASVEGRIQALEAENALLRAQIDGHCKRIESEILTRNAEAR